MLNLVPLAGEQVSDLEIKPLNLKSKILELGGSKLAVIAMYEQGVPLR